MSEKEEMLKALGFKVLSDAISKVDNLEKMIKEHSHPNPEIKLPQLEDICKAFPELCKKVDDLSSKIDKVIAQTKPVEHKHMTKELLSDWLKSCPECKKAFDEYYNSQKGYKFEFKW